MEGHERSLTENALLDPDESVIEGERLSGEQAFKPSPPEATEDTLADVQPELPSQPSPVDNVEPESTISSEDDGPDRPRDETTAPEPIPNDESSPVDLNNSVFEQVANLEGPGASLTQEIQYVFNLSQAKDAQQKDEEEKTLLEFTTVLPSREIVPPAFITDAVSGFVLKLKEERLLLISCPDEDLAIAAALAVMDRLGFPNPDQRRLLTFDRTLNEQQIPNIYNLRNKEAGAPDIAVLVDAATDRAKPFLDSIYYSSKISLAALSDDLRRNDLYLLCLVEPAKSQPDAPLAENGRPQVYDSRFSCWSIPFLSYLLQTSYPEQHQELEHKIFAQRERGWWKADDNEFYFELKSYIARQELPAAVQAREASAPPPPPQLVFQGDDSLKDIIVYVATFFPKLTPHEFIQIVSLFLSEHDAEREQNLTAAAKSGNEEPTEQLLRKLWRDSPDKLLRECRLVAIPTKDSTKGISFNNYKLEQNLKEYLENDYCLYLENKFQRLRTLGLLFSPSASISKAVMQQTVGMMISYPEYYGGRWLAAIIDSFEQTLIPGNEGLRSNNSVWRLMPTATPGIVRRQVYLRITELVREMHDGGRLQELADECFEQLILTKNYAALLELVKRLKFAPGFDQFKWLKQLLDRGDTNTRQQVSFYLNGLLKRMDTRIYEVLRSLENWLPDEKRAPQSYSVSARLALQFLPTYGLDTALRFNEKNYGHWHGQYPLFTFQDHVSADANLCLLTKWLFHAGIDIVSKDGRRTNETTVQINVLLTGWFFLLLGRGEMPADPQYRDLVDSQQLLDGPSVADILLRRIVADAKPERVQTLMAHWENETRKMAFELSGHPYPDSWRKELTWKRNLIVELLGKLKQVRLKSPESRASNYGESNKPQ